MTTTNATATDADRTARPHFRGVDHCSLTVTDLDGSEAFYTRVLGFTAVLDFGYGRVLIHKATGFTLGLMRHPEGTRGPFSELETGLDHLGLAAHSRDELVAWQERFDELGVTYTPIRDMELAHHLNFRDPDGIALELSAPNEVYAAVLEQLRTTDMSDDEVRRRAVELPGVGGYVADR